MHFPRIIKTKKFILAFVMIYAGFLGFISFCYPDFGMSWDEPAFLSFGKTYWETGFHHLDLNNPLMLLHLKTHGACFEMLTYSVLKMLGKADSYEALHFFKACLFSLTVIFLFFCLLKLKLHPTAMLLGVLLFLVFPRWVGDIFDNHMDGTATLLTSVLLLGAISILKEDHIKKRILYLSLFSVVTAVSISHRVVLGMIPFFTGCLLIYSIRHQMRRRDQLLLGGWCLVLFFFTLWLVDPYIRLFGLSGLWDKISVSSNLGVSVTNNLFNGKLYPANENPWYYIPVWLLVTVPEWTIVLFFSGTILMIYHLIKNKEGNRAPLILVLLLFYFPLLLNLVLKPVVFDGWRHFQFLSIPIVIISAMALDGCLKTNRRGLKILVVTFTGFSIIWVGYQMVRLYPYQYIYFNSLTGGLPGAYERFETDYWGKSYKEAVTDLGHLLDPEKKYSVKTAGNPIASTYYFPDNFQWTHELSKAQYYISYTRGNEHLLVNDDQTVLTVDRMGIPLCYIKKVGRKTDGENFSPAK